MKRSRASDIPRYLVCLLTPSHRRARACQSWASRSKSVNICIRNQWFLAKICPQCFIWCGFSIKIIFFREFSRLEFWMDWSGNLSGRFFKVFLMSLRFAIFNFRQYFFRKLFFRSELALSECSTRACLARGQQKWCKKSNSEKIQSKMENRET